MNPMLGRQRIHLKHQALFSSKDKSKKLKCRLLQFLFGALRVNIPVNNVSVMSRRCLRVCGTFTRPEMNNTLVLLQQLAAAAVP